MRRPTSAISGSDCSRRGKNALGQDLDAGAGGNALLEPHPVTDRVARRLAEQARHVTGGRPDRQAAAARASRSCGARSQACPDSHSGILVVLPAPRARPPRRHCRLAQAPARVPAGSRRSAAAGGQASLICVVSSKPRMLRARSRCSQTRKPMSAQIIPVQAFDLVVFGGTGDLSVRKLMPALYHRDRDGQLPDEARVIGLSRKPARTKPIGRALPQASNAM